MADKDDEREDRDSDAPESEPKPVEKKAKAAAKAKEPASDAERMLAELAQMRAALNDLREQQTRYLWILFPIGALIAVQTILQATKL